MRDSQIIKPTLSVDDVIKLLKEICIYSKDNIYLFNNNAYKRLRLFKKVDYVINKLRPHYYGSKLFYLTRKMSYKTFSTIIRQLCKYANVELLSNIRYLYSSYIIEYTLML